MSFIQRDYENYRLLGNLIEIYGPFRRNLPSVRSEEENCSLSLKQNVEGVSKASKPFYLSSRKDQFELWSNIIHSLLLTYPNLRVNWLVISLPQYSCQWLTVWHVSCLQLPNPITYNGQLFKSVCFNFYKCLIYFSVKVRIFSFTGHSVTIKFVAKTYILQCSLRIVFIILFLSIPL